MRFSQALLALLSAVAGASVLVSPGEAAKGKKHPDRTCQGPYRPVHGVGQACSVGGGLLKIKLLDGTPLYTHGPDETIVATPSTAPGRPPVCADENPHGDLYSLAILAWPSDVVPNETPASFRDRIESVNAQLFDEAVESGSPGGADYVFACDPSGQIRVDSVQLSTPAAQGNMLTIVLELALRGYFASNEKYVIWYDDRQPGMPCGVGTFWPDETPSEANGANAGPDFGVSFDCDAIMHEHGHNIGAVQYGAPFSSLAGHCWEEQDVMCYDDHGPGIPASGLTFTCTDRVHYDCGHDDYFDARIGAGTGSGPGSYLATHWNIGACYDLFIVNYGCYAAPGQHAAGSATCTAGAPRFSVAPPTVFGHRFRTPELVAWRTHFATWTGTAWQEAHVGSWVIGAATRVSPGAAWWDLASGSFLGQSAGVQQSYSPGAGYSAAFQEVAWFELGGALVDAELTLVGAPAGTNALVGTPLCAWPS